MTDLETIELAARRVSTAYHGALGEAFGMLADNIEQLMCEREKRETERMVARIREEAEVSARMLND